MVRNISYQVCQIEKLWRVYSVSISRYGIQRYAPFYLPYVSCRKSCATTNRSLLSINIPVVKERQKLYPTEGRGAGAYPYVSLGMISQTRDRNLQRGPTNLSSADAHRKYAQSIQSPNPNFQFLRLGTESRLTGLLKGRNSSNRRVASIYFRHSAVRGAGKV